MIADFAVARTAHLDLPEFRAFACGQRLPRMRQWELPFACFAARLRDGMAVLDCTINPCGLGGRLHALYPQLRYQHAPALAGGAFAPPSGAGGAVDRVFCLNTLEHLLAPQRAELIAAMARLLAPGGLLVLTSDCYFDRLWDEPHLQGLGVMRADRSEVFGGWNKVTPSEWRDLCTGQGLTPLLLPDGEPQEDDPTLWRNVEPHAHATIAAVFQRPPAAPLPGRRVALTLLTWNTRDVTLESAHAHLQEARMLRRLGHEPFLCICDNGSADGTAQVLRDWAGAIDVPHQLIANPHNRGNSVARNQIIDAVLAHGCDYLLLMDGDIELIPFSSVALLSHMESAGEGLACVGLGDGGFTAQRGHTTPYLFSLGQLRVLPTTRLAWTQYGLFRAAAFAGGVRFDETGALGLPGWGFEDNDLGYQLLAAGYRIHAAHGAVYLHRNVHSSVPSLQAGGVRTRWHERRQLLLEKWSGVPEIARGPLVDVRRMRPPQFAD